MLVLGGCGLSPADQVRAEVRQLARAISNQDYHALCDQILDPSLVAHLTRNGIACTTAMRLGLSGVHDATVSLGKVTVHGSTATAFALTSARGQQASVAAIELRHSARGWRITSLGSPASGAQQG